MFVIFLFALHGVTGDELPNWPYAGAPGSAEVAARNTGGSRFSPQQRQGSAAGRPHYVAAGSVNRTVPVSARGRYPAADLTPHRKPEPVGVLPAAALRGFDAKHSREVVPARSTFQRTYDNPDGSQSTAFSIEPVNYRKPDGTWAPVDTTLAPVAGGGWRTTADALGNVYFSSGWGMVFKIAAGTGAVDKVAGQATTSYGGDGG
ncbi:MAG TPA: hypothetical protein VJT31_15015, partial [Rugosimonospora sp.]|nr:hypothetical protein [Rugosimonospora sp.]